MNLTKEPSSYCTSANDQAVPGDVADCARWVLLDEIGCMILGSTMLPGKPSRKHALETSGHGKSTVLESNVTALMPPAALANSTANHADELDGTHTSEGHPGAMVFPESLAAAENNGSSGEELLNAIAPDVGTRIKDAIGGRILIIRIRSILAGIAYTYGTIATAGSPLDLDADKFAFTFAMAIHHANKLAGAIEEHGHMTKAFNCGQASYAKKSTATTTRIGVTATSDILGSAHRALVMWSNDPDFGRVIQHLGSEHTIRGAIFKLDSTGYPIHSPIAACSRALEEHAILIEGIAGIEIHPTTSGAQAVDNRDMSSICFQDILSVTMIGGRLELDLAHDTPFIHREDSQGLRKKVVVLPSPELDANDPRGRDCKVILTLAEGARSLKHRMPQRRIRELEMLCGRLLLVNLSRISLPKMGKSVRMYSVNLSQTSVFRQPCLALASSFGTSANGIGSAPALPRPDCDAVPEVGERKGGLFATCTSDLSSMFIDGCWQSGCRYLERRCPLGRHPRLRRSIHAQRARAIRVPGAGVGGTHLVARERYLKAGRRLSCTYR